MTLQSKEVNDQKNFRKPYVGTNNRLIINTVYIMNFDLKNYKFGIILPSLFLEHHFHIFDYSS